MSRIKKVLTISLVFSLLCSLVACTGVTQIPSPEKVVATIVEEEPVEILEDLSRPYISDRTYEYTTRHVSPSTLICPIVAPDFTPEETDTIYEDSHIWYDNFYLRSCNPKLAKNWDWVVNVHPTYFPFYETEEGNIYFIGWYESITNYNRFGNFLGDETSNARIYMKYPDERNGKKQGNLICMDQYGIEQPLSNVEAITSSDYHVEYYEKAKPWVILKRGVPDVLNQKYNTILLNLETKEMYPFSEEEIQMSSVKPSINGCFIESIIEISEEKKISIPIFQSPSYYHNGNVGLGKLPRIYYYLDFTDNTFKKVSSPTNTCKLFTSAESNLVVWYDTEKYNVYVQDIAVQDEAILVLENIQLYLIQSSSSSSFWLQPFPVQEVSKTLYLLNVKDTIPSVREIEVPPNLADSRGMYVDQKGRLCWIQEADKNVVLYALYPDAPGILHQYPLVADYPIESLQVSEYVDSQNDMQRVVAHLSIMLTDENWHEFFEEKSTKNSCSGRMVKDSTVHALFLYTLPD